MIKESELWVCRVFKKSGRVKLLKKCSVIKVDPNMIINELIDNQVFGEYHTTTGCINKI